MRAVFLLLIASVLVGCTDPEADWLDGQRQRCMAMGGHPAYSKADKLFECFASKKPLSFEFNKEVDFKQPGAMKLFEARYEKPR